MAGASICILYPADSPFLSPSAALLSSSDCKREGREGRREREREKERRKVPRNVLAAARSIALSFSRYSLAPRGRDV